MKKNKGFTLVELLAVIVILGILMAVGGIAVVEIIKNTNENEASQIQEMLIDLAPVIYSYESTSGIKNLNSYCYKTWDGSYDSDKEACVVDLNGYISKRLSSECAKEGGTYGSSSCINKETKEEEACNCKSKTTNESIKLSEAAYKASAASYCTKADSDGWDESNNICTINIVDNVHQDYFYYLYKNSEIIYISFKELYNANYLNNATIDGIKNPAGGNACSGYISVEKTASGPEFGVCLNCSGIEGYENKDCSITGQEVILTK